LTDPIERRTVRDEQASFLTLQTCWTKSVTLEFSLLVTDLNEGQHVLVPISPFQAKSGVKAELPEDHSCDQEAPEQKPGEDEEAVETYETR
jgi:hypothetical protein